MDLVQNSFAQLELNVANMLHNYKYFRSKLKETTKLLILIKANSYGHGAVEFASQMEKAGADYFGIAHPVEGVELRVGGIKTPIIVLTAGTDSFEDIVNHYLEPSIPSMDALRKFDAYLASRNIDHDPVHIKLDTGMHRLGFMKDELYEQLSEVLSPEDTFILFEPFYAGGTSSFKPSAEEVVKEWQQKSPHFKLMLGTSRHDVAEYITSAAPGKDTVVLIAGARDNSLSDWANSLCNK